MKLTSGVGANLFQFACSALILFGLYKLIASQLGLALLGVWSVVTALTSIARLGDMGLGGSITQQVAKYNAPATISEMAIAVETAVLTSIAVGCVIFFVSIVPLELALSRTLVGKELKQGLEILPYALIFTGISLVAMILQGVLDGMRFMWLRAYAIAFSQILMIGFSLAMIDSLGIIAIMLAQTIQVIVATLIMWTVVRIKVPSLSIIPYRWSYLQFKKLMPHALNLQISSVLVMLVDPLVKIMIAKSGGAYMVGLYEIAHQVLSKARTLVVVANQTAIPFVAEMCARGDVKNIESFYLRSLKITYLSSIPIFLCINLSIPLICQVMIGAESRELSLMLLACSGVWLLNSVTIPAYFVNTSDGKVVINTIGHALTGGAMYLFYLLYSHPVGWAGAVFAWGVAIILGSYFSMIAMHLNYGLKLFIGFNINVFSLTMMVAFSYALAYKYSIDWVASFYILNIAVVALAVVWVLYLYRKLD